VQFTASFGVTDSTRARTLQELIQLADLGLYASKAGGRDRVTMGEPPEEDAGVPAANRRAPRRAPALQRAAAED
jgi:hypothetical protein